MQGRCQLRNHGCRVETFHGLNWSSDDRSITVGCHTSLGFTAASSELHLFYQWDNKSHELFSACDVCSGLSPARILACSGGQLTCVPHAWEKSAGDRSALPPSSVRSASWMPETQIFSTECRIPRLIPEGPPASLHLVYPQQAHHFPSDIPQLFLPL